MKRTRVVAFALACFMLLHLIPAVSESNNSIFRFVLRYNEVVDEDDLSISTVGQPVDGVDLTTRSLIINKNIAMNVQTLTGTDTIAGVMFLATGDGTAKSGLDIFKSIAYVLYAYGLADEMSETGDLIKKIGLLKDDAFNGEQHSHVIGNTRIAFMKSDTIGFMLVLEEQ